MPRLREYNPIRTPQKLQAVYTATIGGRIPTPMLSNPQTMVTVGIQAYGAELAWENNFYGPRRAIFEALLKANMPKVLASALASIIVHAINKAAHTGSSYTCDEIYQRAYGTITRFGYQFGTNTDNVEAWAELVRNVARQNGACVGGEEAEEQAEAKQAGGVPPA